MISTHDQHAKEMGGSFNRSPLFRITLRRSFPRSPPSGESHLTLALDHQQVYHHQGGDQLEMGDRGPNSEKSNEEDLKLGVYEPFRCHLRCCFFGTERCGRGRRLLYRADDTPRGFGGKYFLCVICIYAWEPADFSCFLIRKVLESK